MRKYVFTCTIAVFGLLQGAANAQECSTSCCYEYNEFDGFYVGGNIGIISHTAHRNDLDGFLTDNSGWSTIDTGFTGGVRAGYDFQCNQALIGVLVDWDATSIGRTLHDNPNFDDTNFIKSKQSWFTTIRMRAGVTLCNALLYITGGAAVTKFKTTWRDLPDAFTKHDARWGWVGGFGGEYKFCNNWSFGSEFLYMNFANKNRSFTSEDSTVYAFGHSDSGVVGRFFITYRFSGLFSCCR